MRGVRLFFALQLPDEVRQALSPALDLARRAAGDGVGFTRLEQLHFTLAFLGEQPTPDSAIAAGEALRAAAQFELGIGGRGAFPGMSRPRVLWLGVTEGSAALCAAAEKLQAALRERGFPLDDRKFQPHLTLGRVKPRGDRDARRTLEALPLGELARFPVRSVELMQSVLGAGGAKHALVRSFTLSPR